MNDFPRRRLNKWILLVIGLILASFGVGLFVVLQPSAEEKKAAANDRIARKIYAHEKGVVTADGSLSVEDQAYLDGLKDALMEDYPGAYPGQREQELKEERAGRREERARIARQREAEQEARDRRCPEVIHEPLAFFDCPDSKYEPIYDE